VPRLAQVLPRLAGRARLHLDVKDPGAAAEAAGLALGSLGPAGVVLTTRDREVARMVGRRFPVLQAGLAVGGDFAESARFLAQRAGRPGLSRLDAVEAAGATWAALHHRQAAAGLAAQCRERGLKTLVWTVNADRALARWLACPDVDVLVTDRPAHAVALRDRPATRAAGPDRSARPGPPDGRTGPVPGSGR
jgi:glycerophosphoryl diester phosphodiesterase